MRIVYFIFNYVYTHSYNTFDIFKLNFSVQRKEYSESLNRQPDNFHTRVEVNEKSVPAWKPTKSNNNNLTCSSPHSWLLTLTPQHLFTCELDGMQVRTEKDCVEKLKKLDAKGRLWPQEMIMEIQGGYVVLSDIETKVGFNPWRNYCKIWTQTAFCLKLNYLEESKEGLHWNNATLWQLVQNWTPTNRSAPVSNCNIVVLTTQLRERCGSGANKQRRLTHLAVEKTAVKTHESQFYPQHNSKKS